jgi:hypothetical protein
MVLKYNKEPLKCHSNCGSSQPIDFHGLLFIHYLLWNILTSGMVNAMATKQILEPDYENLVKKCDSTTVKH